MNEFLIVFVLQMNTNIDKAARFLVDRIMEHADIFQQKKVQRSTFQPGNLYN